MIVYTKEKHSFEVSEGKSILEAALNSGVVFEYSCKNGQCGVCKTELLEGEVKELMPQLALTLEEKKAGKILTCCCEPVTDVLIDAENLSALQGIEIKTLPARVSTIEKLTSELIKVTLRLPPTANFQFVEGQYLDVIWSNLRRSYSIASTTSEKEITLLIKRYENGEMSNYWFNHAKENDLLRIEGPKGTFFLRTTSKPLVFLATGTGIAPIISILEKLDSDDGYVQTERIELYWGNRFPREFVWQPEFEKIKVDFIKVLSQSESGWKNEIGYVQDVALPNQSDLMDCEIYACGSNAMIKSAKCKFVEAGLPESHFYSDAFVQSY